MVFAIKPKMLFKFDKSILKTNWAKINESPIKRAGLLARRIERGLIRQTASGKKRRPSRPGKPPRSHHPSQIFRRIYSVPNFLETNVIIGHVGLYGGQTAMEIQEFGQSVVIKERLPFQSRRPIANPVHRKKVREMFVSGRLVNRHRKSYQQRMIKMPKRPFAKPTLERTAKRLPALWANSVSSATIPNRANYTP
jgi:hypothetical protein